ncbi:diguanylate cyclase [Aerosakkonemataceae cyanobacterium BLCC-F154]|uniref:Diguanylate cyclase n=1 Tax=Floridaenema fluviatile BLCC-F154 TaxID=3153640 RepID=A0ABV4YLH0_9CYAN
MEPNYNHQPEELQLLEKIVIQSGELNQQLSVKETLVAQGKVKPKLLAAKNQLETQLAHSILELRQAYQEIQLQIIENERTQKLIEEQAELLNLVHDAILIRDLNNIISFWNQGAERMYGFPKYEALAKSYHSLLRVQYSRPLSEIQAEVFQKGCWEGEVIHTKSDGTQIAVCSRWILRKDAKNQPQEIIEINKDITVTKDTEEALFAVGVRLAGILDSAKDAIVSIDEQGKITLFNQSAEKIFGYSAAEVLRKSIDLLISFESLEKYQSSNNFYNFIQLTKKLLENGLVFGKHKNGSKFPIEASVSQIELVTGKVFTLILRDITQRVQAEEALRQSEEIYRQMFQANQAIMLIIEPVTGLIVDANSAAYSFYGYHPDKLKQMKVTDLALLPPEKLFAHSPQNNSEKQDCFYSRHRIASGKIRDVEIYSSPITRQGQELVYSVIHDITERKQTEAALHEDELILRSFYHSAPMMMGIIEIVDDNILHISDNAATAEFFGTTPEAMQNQLASDVSISSQHINTWIQHCYESEKTGNPACFEYQQNTSIGLRWVSVTVCPIQKETSKLVRNKHYELILSVAKLTSKFSESSVNKRLFCYLIEDITDRKKSQENLEKTNEKLTRWVKELEARNQEIILLGEMSNILQACLTTEEAYNTVAQLIEPLFPNMSGAVFVISNSKQLVSAVASWGDASATTEMLFTPNECWGLRRGRSHLMESSHNPINCKHSHHNSPNVESLCVPMMAQGEALGVLYLSATETGVITQAKQQLAITVAEQIALAFANLKLHEALQQQSIRDPLTSLFNRRYLEESLEREMSRAQRKQQSVGIIMLDVDHFKRFNDTFGHDAGDTLLRELGIFIKKNIRGSDIACRFGGEEFLVILPEASLEVTMQRAEQIREGIKHINLHSRQQQLGTITLSLGVAIFPENGMTGEMVIQAADSALYQAKAQGRDRVIVAS